MAGNLMADAHATLAATLLDAMGVDAIFRYGPHAIPLQVVKGKPIYWPYDGARTPPTGLAIFVPPASLVFGDRRVRPEEGHGIDLPDENSTPDKFSGERFELVPLGDEPPARLIDSGTNWRCTCLETTFAPRRDTRVELQMPTSDRTPNKFGELDRNDYTRVAHLAAKIASDEGHKEPLGGKLVGVHRFRVTVVGRPIALTARFKVLNGWLKDRLLYVEAISRQSAEGLETEAICRMSGG